MEKHELRAGVFIAPFHSADEDPTLALERDFALVEHLDRLGFDEAWIGEHHSGGFEMIAAPDLFIAAAAVRTRRIHLGTGVLSLPYYHPYIIADRIVQLDHQTRGRVMWGVGPGVLPSDNIAMNVPIERTRDWMEASLDVIIRLLEGERVTCESEGFSIRDARLQLPPYTSPRPHIAVASSNTPNGGRLAGKYGLGLLGSAFARDSLGFDAIELNWRVANDTAAEYGRTFDRRSWRFMAPFHLAPTREQALAEVKEGYAKWDRYRYALFPAGGPVVGITTLDEIHAGGKGAIGTPDDALAVLERLWEKTGGFGCIILLDHGWADWSATQRSYDLFARYVMPKFAGRNVWREDSMAAAALTAVEAGERVRAAARRKIDQYFAL